MGLTGACIAQKSLEGGGGHWKAAFAFSAPASCRRHEGLVLWWFGAWGVCDSWQEALQLPQGHAGAEWQCEEAGVRQALGHAAGRRSVLTHPGRSLLPVTVTGLGHWHLYPEGNQFPEKKKIKDWARGAVCTDSGK